MRALLILSATILVSLSGCYYDVQEELYPISQQTGCDTTGYSALTYQNGISAIINTNCAYSGCHVSGAQNPPLSTYPQVLANLAAVEQRAIVQQDMPAGGMQACDRIKLKVWINSGAPQ